MEINQRSWRSQRSNVFSDRNNVSDHMETEGRLYLEEGSEKFHYVFTFRFRNYFLGANVTEGIICLESLAETGIFAKINFIKQGK